MMRYLNFRRPGQVAVVFGAVAAALYTVMILWTLPQLEAVSGQVAFDMRPLGYSAREAATLLEGLGSDGRTFYVSRQIPLDMIYPSALMITLLATLSWLVQRVRFVRLANVAGGAAMIAAFADYIENIGIVTMIARWPNVPSGLVHAASLSSIVKAFSTTVSVLIVIALFALWLGRLVWGARVEARCSKVP